MKNVTITLDEKTAAWVRVAAAREDQSVSRYIAGLLEQRMRASHDYASAMRRFLERKPARIGAAGAALPARDELHDRSGLR
ncbi:MAG: CopG family transcriptional regulator [Burkholderiaceae bacterium]|nr:CopG family transcriptional regulator [Burkholderiaceae bacterium]